MQDGPDAQLGSESGESPVRLGIVGCSTARTRYGAAFPFVSSVRVTALADADTKLLRAWGRLLGADVQLYADLSALLADECVPEALVLDVPLLERAEAILSAIPHCRALLCPPPFAATLEETDKILHAASAHGTSLLPAFPRRYDPVMAQAIEMARSGEVGLPQQIRCDWSFSISKSFGIEIGADPRAETWAPLLQYAACHAADVCRWGFGDVLTVSADIDLTEPIVAAGRRDSGPLLANFVLGQEEGPGTCHFSRSKAVTPFERYILTGTQGSLELVFASATHVQSSTPVLTIRRTGQRPAVVPIPDTLDPDLPAPVYRTRAMLEHLAGAARTGQRDSASGAEARAALEVVHAAYLSARDSRKVTLPLRRSPAGLPDR